jgi:hypothetical protein
MKARAVGWDFGGGGPFFVLGWVGSRMAAVEWGTLGLSKPQFNITVPKPNSPARKASVASVLNRPKVTTEKALRATTIGKIGADGVVLRRPVVGPRPQLDADGGGDVCEAGTSGLGEVEEQGLRIGRIDLQVPALGAVQQASHGFLKARQEGFPDAVLAGALEGLDAPGLLLTRGCLWIVVVTKAQELAMEGDVHVLRKTVDEAVNLGERGATFEHKVTAKLWQSKEGTQGFANPVVLFQNGWGQPALLRGGVEEFQALPWSEREVGIVSHRHG